MCSMWMVNALHKTGTCLKWVIFTIRYDNSFNFLHLPSNHSAYLPVSWDFLGPLSWGCRKHWLHLCRRVRRPQRLSWIKHLTIRWWDSSNSDEWMTNTPLLLSISGPFCSRAVAPDRVLSISRIELNCELMINRIVWHRTVYICCIVIYRLMQNTTTQS